MADQVPEYPGFKTRRRIIGSIAATSASLAAAPLTAKTAATANSRHADAGLAAASPITAFAGSFEAVPESFGPTTVAFHGKLPSGFAGTLIRNGPARFQRGSTRMRHWFDGDGMVHAYDVADGKLTHRARMVATQRAAQEAKAGRFLYDGFGTHFEDARRVASPDAANVANISVLPMAAGNEFLALWEAGSAYRIDRKSLQTTGRKVWSEQTDGIAFSAHPRVGADGHIWNFGYLPGSGKLLLYDIAASGKLQRSELVDMPNADMVHDFAVTDTHLVFLLSPLRFEPGPGNFRNRLKWQADKPSLLVLVDKNTLQPTHRFEMAPFFFFHLGNAWNDGSNIHVQVMRTAGFDSLMDVIEGATMGQPVRRLPDHPMIELVANTATANLKVADGALVGADFPSFDPRYVGRPSSRLVAMTRSADMPDEVFGFNSVALYDRVDGRPGSASVAKFSYGTNTIAEEHLLIPKPGAVEGVGWIIGTAYNWRKRTSSLSVFDTEQLAGGPVATAQLPYSLPLGLHGKFVTA